MRATTSWWTGTLLAIVACGPTKPPDEPRPGPSLQEGAPWPMYRQGPDHGGRARRLGPRAPRVRWQFTPPSGDPPAGLAVYCPPSVGADGTLYAGSDGGPIYAISPDGSLKWSAPAPGHCGGSPTIASDGTVYARKTALHALGPDGSPRWSFQGPVDELEGSPALASDGTVYVCVEAVGIVAVSADGRIRWTFPTAPDAKTSPAVARDGTVYVAANDRLYALSPLGKEVWQALIGDSQHVTPVLAPDGTIYAGTQGRLYAFSASGVELWSIAIAGLNSQFPPALGPDGVLHVAAAGALLSFRPDGTEQRRLENAVAFLETPLVDSEGTVYFADENCTVHGVTDLGREKWAVSLTSAPAQCSSPVMGVDGTLYLTAGTEGIIALGDDP